MTQNNEAFCQVLEVLSSLEHYLFGCTRLFFLSILYNMRSYLISRISTSLKFIFGIQQFSKDFFNRKITSNTLFIGFTKSHKNHSYMNDGKWNLNSTNMSFNLHMIKRPGNLHRLHWMIIDTDQHVQIKGLILNTQSPY